PVGSSFSLSGSTYPLPSTPLKPSVAVSVVFFDDLVVRVPPKPESSVLDLSLSLFLSWPADLSLSVLVCCFFVLSVVACGEARTPQANAKARKRISQEREMSFIKTSRFLRPLPARLRALR